MTTAITSPEQSATASRGRPSCGTGVLLALLLVTATLIAYWPAMHGGFVWDDNDHISENKTLHSAHGLWEIWFKPGATCQYYPLTFSGFWAGYQLWGLNVFGYHLLNVLLHCVVAILLWQALARLEVRGAWLAGMIFALHPVCVMSVAWMTELKNTLSAALALAAGWAYLRFVGLGVYQPKAARHWQFYVLSLVLFQLALFAKTAVSFLPVSLFLVTWWRRDRLQWRDLWPLIPMLGVVGAMGWLTFHIEHLHGASGQQFHMNFLERLLVSGRSFWFYLGKLFYPHNLTFIYQRWQVDSRDSSQYLFPLAAIAVLFGVWWLRHRIGKGWFAALAHFYVCTSLLILLVVLYMTRYSFVSDHWQYFGCMSVIALVAAGISAGLERSADWSRHSGTVSRIGNPQALELANDLPTASRRYGRLPVCATCGGLLLLLAVLTWRQCGMYAGMETLWRTTLDRSPRSTLAHNNLGELLAQRGQLDEAMDHFQKALRIEPGFAEAHYNFGNALVRKGRLDEAMSHFQKALELQPDFAEAHNNLGNILLEKGRLDDAMDHFRKALAYEPDFAEARYNVAKVFVQKGQVDDAILQLQKVLEIQPEFAEVHINLGSMLVQKGKGSEAIAHFQMAVKIRPDFADAYFNLGEALFQTGQMDVAAAAFQKAIDLQPSDAEAHHKLGLILFRKNQPTEALGHCETALKLQPDNVQFLADVAWALATCRDGSLRDGGRAIELAQRAVQLSGNRNPRTFRVLAAAYAEGGQLAQAITAAERARELALAQGDTALAESVGSELKLYRAGTPVRDW